MPIRANCHWSCPVAPPSQRVASCANTGGDGGGGVARRARAARAPKAGSCAMSFGMSSATPSAAPCAASFTCHPRAARGAARVCWVRVPPLEDDVGYHDGHLYAPVLRHILRQRPHVRYSKIQSPDTHRHGAAIGRPPAVRTCDLARSSKLQPRAPPPDSRLKPGPVFVAS